MADTKVTGMTANTTPVTTDVVHVVVDPGGTPVDRKVTLGNLYKGLGTGTPSATTYLAGDGSYSTPSGTNHTWKVRGHCSNPQAVYTQQAQLFIMRAEANLTITRIHIQLNCDPTTEMAGDLKWADDITTGSYANATVIDVCDTTAGAFTATSSFDDATVSSGKYIYYQFDASPHADIKSFYFEMYYTLD